MPSTKELLRREEEKSSASPYEDEDGFRRYVAREKQKELRRKFNAFRILDRLGQTLAVDPLRPDKDDQDKWDLQVGDVVRNPDGTYDHSVRLLFSRPDIVLARPDNIPHFFRTVQVVLAPRGHLSISGMTEAYSENISGYEEDEAGFKGLIARMEDGFVQAFDNPAVSAASIRRTIPDPTPFLRK